MACMLLVSVSISGSFVAKVLSIFNVIVLFLCLIGAQRIYGTVACGTHYSFTPSMPTDFSQ